MSWWKSVYHFRREHYNTVQTITTVYQVQPSRYQPYLNIHTYSRGCNIDKLCRAAVLKSASPTSQKVLATRYTIKAFFQNVHCHVLVVWSFRTVQHPFAIFSKANDHMSIPAGQYQVPLSSLTSSWKSQIVRRSWYVLIHDTAALHEASAISGILQ
jgi:hypothetical protein